MAKLPERRRTDAELADLRQRADRSVLSAPSPDHRIVHRDDGPVSVRQWLLILVILALPVVNFIVYFYWGFFSDGNLNRRNYCRASLIFMMAAVLISVVLNAWPLRR